MPVSSENKNGPYKPQPIKKTVPPRTPPVEEVNLNLETQILSQTKTAANKLNYVLIAGTLIVFVGVCAAGVVPAMVITTLYKQTASNVINTTSVNNTNSSANTTTSLVSTTTVVNPGFFAYTNLTGCQPYYCAEQVHLINNITVTALTIIIRVQKTSAATYHGVANNFWTGYINSNHTDNGSQIIYTFVLDPTQTVVASTTWYVEAQMDLYGTSQVTSADTYTVSVTGGGITNSYSGHF